MTAEYEEILEASLRALWQWAPFSEQHWWDAPDYPGVGCYGCGFGHWGGQTNLKYTSAMAVLASYPDRGFAPPSFPCEKAMSRALQSLRFALASHVTGDYHDTAGQKWGGTTISALAFERALHGIELIDHALSEEDRQRLRTALIFEADHQLGEPTPTSMWNHLGDNRPESNMWNGAICARAALYYPEHAHVAAWREKANSFFINAISVPADAGNETMLDGKMVKDWHQGANFFPHFALDHHQYMNVGYMVITMSNLVILHYAFTLRGQAAPPALYHHGADLWAVLRRMIFADGRLARIGGDSRIRYSYCQEFLLPCLIFAADHLRDAHALSLAEGMLGLIAKEQQDGGDGRFYGSRVAAVWPNAYYYPRLESDRANVLSMALRWLSERDIAPVERVQTFEESVAGGWQEDEHGDVLHRSPTRLVSWSWHAAEPPQGLCLPPQRSDMAEWMENLGGGVHAQGSREIKRTVEHFTQQSFAGGFLTIGTMREGSKVDLREGYWREDVSATHHLVFAALPDQHTALRLELAIAAPWRSYFEGWEGVKLEMPNDLFNGRQRCYYHEGGQMLLASYQGERQLLDLESAWVNVDDLLGVAGIYGAGGWSILRRGQAIGGKAYAYGSILTDALCYGIQPDLCDVYGPRMLLDNATLIAASVTAAQTRALQQAARRVNCAAQDCRAAQVQGMDGATYLLLANFSLKGSACRMTGIADSWRDLVTGETLHASAFELPVDLSPRQARLFRKE